MKTCNLFLAVLFLFLWFPPKILPDEPFQMDISADWKFQTDPENKGKEEKWFTTDFDDYNWKTLQAARTWEEQGFADYDGYAWYRRWAFIPEDWKGKSIFLIFGGVDDEYNLYINGEKISHWGSLEKGDSVFNRTTWTEISSAVEFGDDNLIALYVDDWGGAGGICRPPVTLSSQLRKFVSWEEYAKYLPEKKPAKKPKVKILHNPWVLTAQSLQNYFPAYLGNGYLGMKVFQLGTGYSPWYTPEAYIAGVYNQSGGVPKIVNIPCFAGLEFNNGTADFVLGEGEIISYKQSLDIYNGRLDTKVKWEVGKKVTDFDITIFLSRDFPHGAIILLKFVPHYTGQVTITSALAGPATGRGNSAEYEEVNKKFQADKNLMSLLVQTTESKIKIAESSIIQFSPNIAIKEKSFDTETLTRICEQVNFPVTRDERYEIVKYVSIYTSLDSASPIESARESVEKKIKEGFSNIYSTHKKAWNKLWNTDIIIEEDPKSQQIVHSLMFYLLESAPESSRWSVAPMGLSGSGYNGHIFWDAEIWMYPALLLTYPEIAKSILTYRYNTLSGAKLKAEENGYEGAMFAWESATTGKEVTPSWAATGKYEQHITGDVAFAHWLYWLATRDRDWLENQGWPVIWECCRFWASRVEYNNELKRYEINQVIGPDEYHEKINNNAYTNVIAKKTLEIGIKTAELMGKSWPSKWEEIVDKLYIIPPDKETGVIPEFDGYRGDTIKQADVVLLFYPLGYAGNSKIIRKNLSYYAIRTDPNGPAMSDSIHSVISSGLGQSLRAYRYFLRSFRPYVKPPFNQFSETPTNNNFCFLTGAGGCLQSLIYGFAGLRIKEEGLSINPCLPRRWKSLKLKNFFWQGSRFDLKITPEEAIIKFTSTKKEKIPISFWNKPFQLELNQEHKFPLSHEK